MSRSQRDHAVSEHSESVYALRHRRSVALLFREFTHSARPQVLSLGRL